jgi:uncharacterized protein YbjT (DUF2867 family)
MNVVIFGATGMIGQGVLRECLLDAGIGKVLAVGRAPAAASHAKLEQVTHRDFLDFSTIADEVTGFGACFFCLGVSSAGMTEADYRRVSYDTPLAAARVLAVRNPGMTFIYVSGAGADSTGRGRLMWARVKGEAENALLAMPSLTAYVFRPAFVQPMHGIRSRTALYRALYAVAAPLYPLWKRLLPSYVTTTEQIGRAMIAVARGGASIRVLENADINAVTLAVPRPPAG